jgi:hypothetical protein
MWIELTRGKQPMFVNMELIVEVQGHSTGSVLTVAAATSDKNVLIGVDQAATAIMQAISQSGEKVVWASR